MTRRIELCRKRNIGIVAHVDAGKTTLTERVLYLCGAVHRMGEVHEGSTTTDSDAIERRKGITITAATVTCLWHDHEICIVNTPGHIDFSAEVELALRVLDGVVVVLDGVVGVESQTEAVWRQADRYELARVCFVNKLDRLGASFEHCLDSLRERLGTTLAVVTLPIGMERSFSGVVDVVEERALVWSEANRSSFDVCEIPPELLAECSAARRSLVELCADHDAELGDAYLAETPVSAELLRRALRRATCTGAVVPVLCGAAYTTRGIEPLLDAVAAYLPSPADRPDIVAESGESRSPSDDAPLSALVFKITADDFGTTAVVRIYSGVLRKGARVSASGKTFRVGRISAVFADRRSEIAEACAGDVVGIMANLRVGDTVCDPDHPVRLRRPVLGPPVVRVALEPKTREDVERLASALPRIVRADPSLETGVDPESGRTLLCGQGELHLEVALERLSAEHGVLLVAGRPSVAYREAIRDSVRHEVKLSKQTGGPGMFAHVMIVVSPAEPGTGLSFSSEIRGGTIPSEFVRGVRAGAEQAMGQGAFAGFPVLDLAVCLVDGAIHPKDSSEQAFCIAARQCVLEAMGRARPYLLEPIMTLEVLAPPAHVGAIVGDVGARRGRVTEIGDRGTERVVHAAVPLAETFGYAGSLRSLTSGRGTFSMTFSRYAAAPAAVVRAKRSATS